MKKRNSNTEQWVSNSWLARRININRGTLHGKAVRMRLRFFKFNGVRYIELNHAICLVKAINPENLDEIVSELEQYKC